AVRIADGRRAIGEGAIKRGDRLVDDLALGADMRDLRAGETHAAHVHGDELAAVLDLGTHVAAGSLDGEDGGLDQTGVPKVTRKNAQTVARLLGLGAVGIENAQTKLAVLAR